MPQRFRRRVVQVPRQNGAFPRPRKESASDGPIHRNGMFTCDFLQRFRFVRARVSPDEMLLVVQNFQRHKFADGRSQVVIDDGAVGRIFSGGGIPAVNGVSGLRFQQETRRFLRFEKMRAFFGDLGVHLPKGRDVIENPERTTVRGDDQIVAMNREIAHGRVRRFSCSGCQSSPSLKEM